MQFVTVREVMDAIGREFEVSETERAETLRLSEEVAPAPNPGAPSPFGGKTMGDLRQDVIAGLASAFARAFRISRSAAVLDNVLHHAHDSGPALFDLRQTGLPRENTSALRSELCPILIGAAKFETRLVAALEAGRFRNYPRHGGSHGIGMSPDDWTSHPNDSHTLRNVVFDAMELIPIVRAREIAIGEMRDAFTGEVVQHAPLLSVGEARQDLGGNARVAQSIESKAPAINQRGDVLSPALVLALKEAVRDGVPVDRRMCGKAAYQVLAKWADDHKFPDLLCFNKNGNLAYLVGKEPNDLTVRAVQARVDRVWDKILPLLQPNERSQ